MRTGAVKLQNEKDSPYAQLHNTENVNICRRSDFFNESDGPVYNTSDLFVNLTPLVLKFNSLTQ